MRLETQVDHLEKRLGAADDDQRLQAEFDAYHVVIAEHFDALAKQVPSGPCNQGNSSRRSIAFVRSRLSRAAAHGRRSRRRGLSLRVSRTVRGQSTRTGHALPLHPHKCPLPRRATRVLRVVPDYRDVGVFGCDGTSRNSGSSAPVAASTLT